MPLPHISIRALGSKKEKGLALERTVGTVWSELGYRNIRFNIHATGEEIDVVGTHLVTDEALKGQCKAHSKKIGTTEVRQFYGDVTKDRGKNKHLTGLLVSLSGFNGTALRWYEELSTDDKSYFKLSDGPQFLQHLIEAGLILDPSALIADLKTKLQVSQLSLFLTERGPFWMVALADSKSDAAYYTLLTALGETPRQNDIEYLKKRLPRIPKETVRVSLINRNAVMATLLKQPNRTLNEIANMAQYPPEDIEAALSSLISERAVSRQSDHFTLRVELDSFLTIANFCLGTLLETDFMLSHFYEESREKLLMSYISGKYLITPSDEEKQLLNRILALSPAALIRVIQGDAESFRNTEEHLKQLTLSGEQAEKIRGGLSKQLIESLTHDLCYEQMEKHMTAINSHHGIVVTMTDLSVKLAKRRESFLKLHARRFSVIAKAGGPVKAGQLVFATGPGPMLEAGDAMSAMEEFDQAIASYDIVIAQFAGTEAGIAALNNKGICYLRQGKLDEAIATLSPFVNDCSPYNTDKVTRETAIKNLAVCYAQKGDSASASSMLALLESKLPASAS